MGTCLFLGFALRGCYDDFKPQKIIIKQPHARILTQQQKKEAQKKNKLKRKTSSINSLHRKN